jgi:hypothetical protein
METLFEYRKTFFYNFCFVIGGLELSMIMLGARLKFGSPGPRHGFFTSVLLGIKFVFSGVVGMIWRCKAPPL